MAPVCGSSACAGATRDHIANTIRETKEVLEPMFREHSAVWRYDWCGEWGKAKKYQGCKKVTYCNKECQQAG